MACACTKLCKEQVCTGNEALPRSQMMPACIFAHSRTLERAGIGKQLLAWAEHRAARKGCSRMLLTVNDDNRKARTFFERHVEAIMLACPYPRNALLDAQLPRVAAHLAPSMLISGSVPSEQIRLHSSIAARAHFPAVEFPPACAGAYRARQGHSERRRKLH